MSNNIRIKTTPNGTDKYISLKLDQDFDFIEILSLKIGQDKAYETFCSDYGVIAGRVIINNGFGVPNAKVSVFIPISDEDKENIEIKSIYPYENVNDVDNDGIRYNLLPKENDSRNDCHTIVGTFASKREQLDNDVMLEVYCKYYKFTTTTNYAGDFMIFGVPLGQHTVHVDVDISDIGIASQRPYDLIEQGTPSQFFYSPTKFKSNKNLNSLVQIKSTNIGVNVQPFWGDLETCVVGINRLDIDLNHTIRPSAIFMGSIFGDSSKNSINKRCRPRKKMGEICEQVPRAGTIEMLRKTIDGQIERFDVDGGRVIDDNGAWAYQVPMNLDYVVTDEEGNLIPSDDPNRGIPTRARVRFRVSMDEGGGAGRLRTRGKYIIPHNPKNKTEIDFSFDKNTPDNNNTFRDFYWNKIYTVKSFIPRVERNMLSFVKAFKRRTHTGIKNVDGCVGDKSPMPFNRAYVKGNVLFTIICFLFSIIAFIVSIFNRFLCALIKIKIVGIRPFGFLRKFLIRLKCPNEEESQYKIGCDDSLSSYLDCVSAVLAEQLDLFEFDFYNDWINGSLYYYLLKYKKKRKGLEKFCETNCLDYTGGTGYNPCRSSKIVDTTYNERENDMRVNFTNGLLVKYENELYYPPILLNGKQLNLFATDIVNLGAVLDCDWQGLPKIVTYLTNTSYKIPPLLAESYADEDTNTISTDQTVVAGIFDFAPPNGTNYSGVFFNVNCTNGVDYDEIKARNIRRQCELNVDLLEYTGSTQRNLIGISDIYDEADPVDVATSINRYVRDSFYLLNVSGSSIQALPQVPYDLLDKYQGTSFNVDTNIQTYINGSGYTEFRGWVPPYGNGIVDMSFQTDNSFYMYFGLIPGKTGLDKLKNKFFTECVRENAEDFIIDTTPKNVSTSGGTDGSITFTFFGGNYPFTYTWAGIDVSYSFGPVTTNTLPPNGQITGLSSGTYQITAVDATGIVAVKEVTVGEPVGFSCGYQVVQNPSTQTSNDGIVEIISITSGVLPYSLSIYDINNTLYNAPLIFITEPVSEVLPVNFNYGIYTFIVTDNNGQTCTQTVNINAPQPLQIINLENYNCCNDDCSGSFGFDIAGGTPPYVVTGTFSATTSVGPFIQISTPSSGDTIQSDLCKGWYRVEIEDSGEPTPQVIQQLIQIEAGLQAFAGKVSTGTSNNYIVSVVVAGGSPDVTVLINGEEYVSTIGNFNYQRTVLSDNGVIDVTVYDNIGCQIDITI